MPKYVVSSTLDAPEWNNTTVIKGDVAEEVAKLKEQLDGNILVYGSAQLLDTLLEQDLVEPEGRRGAEARPDLDVVVARHQQRWSSGFWPPGAALGPGPSHHVPGGDRGGRRHIQCGHGP